jgi:diketogulonate reductase-like aldo/keto reductase
MKEATYSAMDAKTATLDVGGAKIPVLGFGTYGMAGPRLQNILVAALQRGFRHIDTAQMYQNEADVGAAIRASGIPRDAIFVTTKVWVDNYIRQRFMASVDESLRRLQSETISICCSSIGPAAGLRWKTRSRASTAPWIPERCVTSASATTMSP